MAKSRLRLRTRLLILFGIFGLLLVSFIGFILYATRAPLSQQQLLPPAKYLVDVGKNDQIRETVRILKQEDFSFSQLMAANKKFRQQMDEKIRKQNEILRQTPTDDSVRMAVEAIKSLPVSMQLTNDKWTTSGIPAADEWLEENQPALDEVYAAIDRLSGSSDSTDTLKGVERYLREVMFCEFRIMQILLADGRRNYRLADDEGVQRSILGMASLNIYQMDHQPEKWIWMKFELTAMGELLQKWVESRPLDHQIVETILPRLNSLCPNLFTREKLQQLLRANYMQNRNRYVIEAQHSEIFVGLKILETTHSSRFWEELSIAGKTISFPRIGSLLDPVFENNCRISEFPQFFTLFDRMWQTAIDQGDFDTEDERLIFGDELNSDKVKKLFPKSNLYSNIWESCQWIHNYMNQWYLGEARMSVARAALDWRFDPQEAERHRAQFKNGAPGQLWRDPYTGKALQITHKNGTIVIHTAGDNPKASIFLRAE